MDDFLEKMNGGEKTKIIKHGKQNGWLPIHHPPNIDIPVQPQPLTHITTHHAQVCHHRQTLKKNRNQSPKTCQKVPQTCKEATGSTKSDQGGLEEGPQPQDKSHDIF